MSFIRSRKHSGSSHSAIATALLLALPTANAMAQEAQVRQQLQEVQVEATNPDDASEFVAVKASSAKQVKPLLETPQTIVVVKKELFAQQQATTLSETLRNTPGITMLMGENGNTATGDSIFMRGFDTQNSIYVDGIRDLGSISRDTFNTEQVEIAKGPAGVDNGRGSASGYVNMASKTAQADSFTNLSAAVGSAEYRRVTADVNQQLPVEQAAVRVNLVRQENGVVGRDTVDNQMTGIATSLVFGLDTATRATVNLLHVQQDQTPDGGIPTVGLPGYYSSAYAAAFADATGPAIVPVDRSNFYGSANDLDHVLANMVTIRLEHDFNAHATLQNTSRYGRSSQENIMTSTNALIVPEATKTDPSTWQLQRIRQAKDLQNQILINQTNLSLQLAQGDWLHNIATGVEFSYENQQNDSFARPTQAAANLYQPSLADEFAMPSKTGATTDGSTTTAAVYLLDTVDLSPSWQLNAGLRAEHYNTDTNLVTVQGTATPQTIPVGTLLASSVEKSENLLSYKLGGTYKPSKDGSIYLSYATSQLPPGGSSLSLSTSASSQDNVNLAPQKSSNLELGTKWQLLNQQLFATAAIFESVNKNEVVREDATTYTQVGEKRVRGAEFGLVGKVTSAFELSAGLALLDPKITHGASYNPTDGATIQWTPKTTLTMWGSYQWQALKVGGGVRYVDSVRRSNRTDLNPSTSAMLEVPDYWVVDAMASYQFSTDLSLQLNLFNLLDEEYIQSMNNAGSRYFMGTPRSAKLAIQYSF